MTKEEFFASKDAAALWDVAVSINRTNPLPLDRFGVFASLEDAEDYIANNPVAYPGQVLTVIGDDSADVYFTSLDGEGGLSLNEIATGVIQGDGKSIEVVDKKIQVKNFGDHYYHYVDAHDDVPAHYELVENAFISGLEPRVTNGSDGLVIEWYEPSSTTVEGLSARIANVEQEIVQLNEFKDTLFPIDCGDLDEEDVD